MKLMGKQVNLDIKPGTVQHRVLSVAHRAVDEDARTAELAFSSEEPYRRWYGDEILDHQKKSIRLDRLRAGGPLLIDHDNSVKSQIGIIEDVRIDADLVGRATVRFGRGALDDEIFQKVKDGIVRNVSVGYLVHEAELIEARDDGVDVYRITDWEPFELSLVAVPADPSVGVGRSKNRDEQTEIIIKQSQEQKTMDLKSLETATAADTEAVARAETKGRDAEQKRAAEIIAIGEQYASFGADKLAARAVREGWTMDAFRTALLEKVAVPPTAADVGLTDKEARAFSFLRCINALANPTDRKAQESAAFERSVSEAVGQKFGRSATGFFIPQEVQRRDLTVGTAADGGYTVATDLLASNFIEVLRNKMMVMRMGAQLLTGLIGSVAIPRATGGATAYWVAENNAPTESQQTFDQVAMSPKTVGAFTDISRRLLAQSSVDVEAFVRNDLATVLALAIDLAAINGSGTSNQPRGVLNQSGIGDVAGGTNGLAPTWAHIVELWSDIAVANADFGAVGLLTNAKVIGKLMTTLKSAGVAGYIVENFPDASGMTNAGGQRCGVSNQVPSNLTKGTSSGVCSAIINGNWNDLIIGNWGTLDLTVDPYTGSTAGTVRVVTLQDVDVTVRHPESFSAMKDALTT